MPRPIPLIATIALLTAPTIVSAQIYYEDAVRILCYHDIEIETNASASSDVTPDMFRDQLETLRRLNYNVVSMVEANNFLAGNESIPPNAVVLTFDDVYLGQYTYGVPIMQEYNYPATFYAHTFYVGVLTSKDHIDWTELGQMVATGLFRVQSHTVTHPNLTTLTPTQLTSELSHSKNTIQNQLGVAVNEICYPGGNTNATVIAEARLQGYEYGYILGGGLNTLPAVGSPVDPDRLFKLRRDAIVNTDTIATFKTKLGYTGTDPNGPIVIDDNTPGGTTFIGFTNVAPATHRTQHGTSYRTAPALTVGSPSSIARWTATIPTSGEYEIYAWWPGSLSPALGECFGAVYTLTHDSTTSTLGTLDQTHSRKGRWNLIGTANLQAGMTAQVELNNVVSTGTVVFADAIKFQRVVPACVADWSLLNE